MRSVNRGQWPTGTDGQRVSFAGYRNAKNPLIHKIGEYCSYCERPGDLHVEHVVPRTVAPQLESEWSNFLLGCVNCNSRKSNDNASRRGYMWPDTHDTFNAYVYRTGGRVSVAGHLVHADGRKARALFELVGLGAGGTATDRRRRKRRQAWDKAVEVRRLIGNDDSRILAVEVALGTGFFSVWMAVFRDDEDMRQRLIDAFPGTRM